MKPTGVQTRPFSQVFLWTFSRRMCSTGWRPGDYTSFSWRSPGVSGLSAASAEAAGGWAKFLKNHLLDVPKIWEKNRISYLSTGVGLCLFWIIWNYDTMSCHHHLKVSYFFPSHWGRFRGVIIKTPTTLVVKIQIHCSTTAEAHTRPGFLDAEAHLRRGGRRCQGAHVTGTNQHVEAPRMLRRCITS